MSEERRAHSCLQNAFLDLLRGFPETLKLQSSVVRAGPGVPLPLLCRRAMWVGPVFVQIRTPRSNFAASCALSVHFLAISLGQARARASQRIPQTCRRLGLRVAQSFTIFLHVSLKVVVVASLWLSVSLSRHCVWRAGWPASIGLVGRLSPRDLCCLLVVVLLLPQTKTSCPSLLCPGNCCFLAQVGVFGNRWKLFGRPWGGQLRQVTGSGVDGRGAGPICRIDSVGRVEAMLWKPRPKPRLSFRIGAIPVTMPHLGRQSCRAGRYPPDAPKVDSRGTSTALSAASARTHHVVTRRDSSPAPRSARHCHGGIWKSPARPSRRGRRRG